MIGCLFNYRHPPYGLLGNTASSDYKISDVSQCLSTIQLLCWRCGVRKHPPVGFSDKAFARAVTQVSAACSHFFVVTSYVPRHHVRCILGDCINPRPVDTHCEVRRLLVLHLLTHLYAVLINEASLYHPKKSATPIYVVMQEVASLLEYALLIFMFCLLSNCLTTYISVATLPY